MRRLVLAAVVTIAAIPVQVSAAIVYSGSQNVVIQLTPMNPMSSMGINLAEQGEKWDDFRVDLWLDMGMMNMTGMSAMMADMPGPSLPMMTMASRLALFAP